MGSTPKPGAHRVNPTKWGICFENWEGASKQKLLLWAGLPCIILFVRGSPQPKARNKKKHFMPPWQKLKGGRVAEMVFLVTSLRNEAARQIQFLTPNSHGCNPLTKKNLASFRERTRRPLIFFSKN